MKTVFRNGTYETTALIETIMIRPQKGAEKEEWHRVWLVDGDGIIFHLSIHKTEEEAISRMNDFGYGMWEEI